MEKHVNILMIISWIGLFMFSLFRMMILYSKIKKEKTTKRHSDDDYDYYNLTPDYLKNNDGKLRKNPGIIFGRLNSSFLRQNRKTKELEILINRHTNPQWVPLPEGKLKDQLISRGVVMT